MHSCAASSNSTDASFVLFFTKNFRDANSLIVFRWFFSNLLKPITCGNIPVADRRQSWIITSIVDTNNESFNIRDAQKKGKNRGQKKRKQLLLTPSTSILFTFSTYRLALCLEVSESMFCMNSDGKMPIDEMTESLYSIISNTHKSLLSQSHISQVYITILVHHAHFTHCLWKGIISDRVSMDLVLRQVKTVINKLDSVLAVKSRRSHQVSEVFEFQNEIRLKELLCSPSENAIDQKNTALTQEDGYHSHQEKMFHCSAAASLSFTSRTNQMNIECFCEGLNYHLNLLPDNACPTAVLITSGMITMSSLSKTSRNLSSANICLHVLVTSMPEPSPLGCVQDLRSLRILAESSGGSFDMIKDLKYQPEGAETFGHIFLRPLYTQKPDAVKQNDKDYKNFDRGDFGKWPLSIGTSRVSNVQSAAGVSLANERCSGLKTVEKRLHCYQLEGSTLEHIIAARCSEGFCVVNISDDAQSDTTYRSQAAKSIGSSVFLTVHMIKHVSKVWTILYDISFRYSYGRSHGTAQPVTTGSGILSNIRSSKSLFRFTTGMLSIDIALVCPANRSLKAIESFQSSDRFNEAQDIFESDKRFAYFLGQPGMPGFVYSGNSCSSSSTNEKEASSQEKNAFDEDNDDASPLFLQSKRENSFKQSRDHLKLLNHLAASADVVADVCYLSNTVTSHIYLRSLILLTNIAGSVRCKDRIFVNLKSAIPKGFFHSLGVLRWLCIIPFLDTSEGGRDPTKSFIFQYEVIIIDIKQISSVFIEVKISTLNASCNSIAESSHVTSEQQEILQGIVKAFRSLDYGPLILRRQLSNVALLPSSLVCLSDYARRKSIMNYCYLESICHFTAMDLMRSNLVESFVRDICRSKASIGLQVMSCASSDRAAEICLCAAIPSCFMNSPAESIIQCKVECSDEGILTTYFWESLNGLSKCNGQGISLKHSTDYLDSLGDSFTPPFMEFLKCLLSQDCETHEFYIALSSIYSNIQRSVKFSPLAVQRQNSGSISVISITPDCWKQLCSYTVEFERDLSAFSQSFYGNQIVDENEARTTLHHEGTENNTNEESLSLSAELRKLLCMCMVDCLGLTKVNLICNDAVNDCCSFTCCYPMRDAVFMIEVKATCDNQYSENSVDGTEPTHDHECQHCESSLCNDVPTNKMVESDENIDDLCMIMSPNSFIDENEFIPHENLSEVTREDNVTHTQEISGAVSESCHCSRSFFSTSGKMILEYKYLPVPVNSLFADESAISLSNQLVLGINSMETKSSSSGKPESSTNKISARSKSTNSTLNDQEGRSNSAISVIPLSLRKILNQLLDDISLYNRCNFALVLYTALRHNGIRRIHPLDIGFALDCCSKEYLEIDVTTVCRVKRQALGELGDENLELSASSPFLFRSTVGKLLTPIGNTNCFLFSGDNSSYDIPMLDNIYRIALFVKIAVVRKNVIASSEEHSEEVLDVPAVEDGLSQILIDISKSSLSASVSKNYDDLFDESIMLRLECLSTSISDISTANKDRGDVDKTSSPIGVPSLGSLQSAYRTSLTRKLTSELQNYVTFATLSILLGVANVTAETIILVQHCLRETSNVGSVSHAVDFLLPPNRNQSSFIESLTGLMEDELVKELKLKKIGAIFYARGWSIQKSDRSNLVGTSSHNESVTSDESCENSAVDEEWVPCWILLTISQCSVIHSSSTFEDKGADNTMKCNGIIDGMSIVSMELQLTLRTIGDYDTEQKLIEKILCSIIDTCARRVNQSNLLKELHETRIATSYLIPDCVPQCDLAPKKGIASIRRDQRRYVGGERVDVKAVDAVVIPTFNFPKDALAEGSGQSSNESDSVDEHRKNSQAQDQNQNHGLSLNWRSFSAGHFSCPVQGSIVCHLPTNHSSALYHDLAIRRLEDSALHPFTISNLRSCFVYQSRNGKVYYMAFKPSADREERKISLVVFGIDAIEDAMTRHLKDLLETKIIEQMAKLISIMCLRQKKLQLSDLHFVKSSGTSRHVKMECEFPRHVSDPYYFLTIVKQIFNASNVFFGNDVLQIQNENESKVLEFFHPAAYGYTVSSEGKKYSWKQYSNQLEIDDADLSMYCFSSSDSEGDNMDNENMWEADGGEQRLEHHNIQRPHLERMKHVPVKVKSIISSEIINPVFFPSHMRKQCPRSHQVCSGSSVLWKQNDFTFLYNYQSGLGEKGQTGAVQSRIGHGLAVIELEPVMREDASSTTSCCRGLEKIFITGSRDSLIDDVDVIVESINSDQDGLIQMSLAPVQINSSHYQQSSVREEKYHSKTSASVDNSSTTKEHESMSHSRSSDCPISFQLRIYPTFPMNTTALVEHCSECFNQALEIYCMERLYSASGFLHKVKVDALGHYLGRGRGTGRPSMKHLFDTTQKLLMASSQIQSGAIGNNGLLDIPFAIPKNSATALHKTILEKIFEKHTYLKKTEVSLRDILLSRHENDVNDTEESCVNKNKYDIDQIEWLGQAKGLKAERNCCNSLLGDCFAPFRRVDQIVDPISSSESGIDLPQRKQESSVELEREADHNRGDDALKCYGDFRPTCCDMESALFPIWLRQRHYSLELTITPGGIRLAYFNIKKEEMRKLIDIIANFAMESITEMKSSQRDSLKSIGVLEMIQYSASSCNNKLRKKSFQLKEEKSQTVKGVSSTQSNTMLININTVSSSESEDTDIQSNSMLDSNDLLQLQTEICGLFWSYRVLSRLYMSEKINTLPSCGHPVVNNVDLIPYQSWSTMGIELSTTTFPFNFVPSDYDYLDEEFRMWSNCNRRSERLLHCSFLSCLRCVATSHECIVLPASSSGGLERPENQSIVLAIILLPVPRTSSLCVYEISRKLRNNRSWLSISQRACDVSDVVKSVASDYKMKQAFKLLSPISEACLQQPSLKTFFPDLEYAATAYSMDPLLKSSQYSAESRCGYGYPPPVLGTILESRSVERLKLEILFACLMTYVVAPPAVFPSEEAVSMYSPFMMSSFEIDSFHSVCSELGRQVVFDDGFLSPFSNMSEFDKNTFASDGLQPPLARDVMISYVSSTFEPIKEIAEDDLSSEKVLCFRFVMDKNDSDRLSSCHEPIVSEGNSGQSCNFKNSDDAYRFLANNVFGLCFCFCSRDISDSFDFMACIFNGKSIVGEKEAFSKHFSSINTSPIQQGSHSMISIKQESEKGMLLQMKECLKEFCLDALKSFYGRTAWKQTLQASLGASSVVHDGIAGRRSTTRAGLLKLLESKANAFCLGYQPVHLPLTTIFSLSCVDRLESLEFILPVLNLFSTIDRAVFLYSLFLKAFRHRVYFLLPEKENDFTQKRIPGCFAYILSSGVKTDPFCILIETSEKSDTHNAAISIVEPGNSKFSFMRGRTSSNDDHISTCLTSGLTLDDLSLQTGSLAHKEPHADVKQCREKEERRKTLAEQAVDILLYASSVLLAQCHSS